MGFRVGALLMALLFLLCAAVQWNDPDPLAWIAVYALAAVLAGAAASGRVPLLPNAAALLLFSVLFVWWAPTLAGARAGAFQSFRMEQARDEEPREAMGLLLCAIWSGVQCRVAWRGRGS